MGEHLTAPELVRRAARRLRLQRAFRATGRGLAFASFAAAAAVLLWRRGWFGDPTLSVIIAVLGGGVLGVTLWCATRGVDSLALAVRLDRASDLPPGALRNSYEFSEPSRKATPDAYAALHLRRFGVFDRRLLNRGLPWRLDASSLFVLVGVLAAGLAWQWQPVRQSFSPWRPPEPPAEQPFTSASTLFEREQLERLRQSVREAENDELSRIFDELEEAIASIEAGSDTREVLQALDELRARLEGMELPEAASSHEALQDAADALGDEPETAALARALRENDLSAAADALDSLTSQTPRSDEEEATGALNEALRNAAESLSPLSTSEDRKLRRDERALERAIREHGADSEQAAAQRMALEARERERQQQASAQSEEAALREQLSRSLRRLAREHPPLAQRAERSARAHEASDRGIDRLETGGRPGQTEHPDASSGAREAAEALREQSRQRQARTAQRQLLRRAESLSESVRRNAQQRRRAGESGQQRAEDMRRFLQRAGADVEALPRAGDRRQAEAGAPRGAGQRGDAADRRLRRLQREESDRSEMSTASTESSPNRSPSSGTGSGGTEAGTGHTPDQFLNPTARHSSGRTVRLRGAPGDDGPSTEQVILGAEDGGFSGVPYREVYQRYRQIREQAVERETIPSGYRFYVERYFELIGPRQ